MGVFDNLFGKRATVDRSQFPVLIPRLALELEVAREQFIFAGVTTLKGEDVPVSDIPPVLEKVSELDSALKAYQLTCVVGFAWGYMAPADCMPFDEALTQHLDEGEANTVKSHRERYLDCQGDIELLSSSLADDIYRMWGYPQPFHRFKRALGNASITLGVISQAMAAEVFGDKKTGLRLRRRLNI